MESPINNGGILFLLGIFLVTALFFITIYFGLDKKKWYLFFFTFAILGGISIFSLLEGFAFSFLIASTFASLSLLYFFASFFENEKSFGIGLLSIILFIIGAYNYKFIGEPPNTIFYVIVWFIYAVVLMACSWISLQAIKHNKFAGNLLFITTTVIFILIVFLVSNSFFISSLTISTVVLIFSVTYAVFRDFKERQTLLKSLRIKAVQLENEMLKKSIQPHFLMNTLTVLSEWIESEPQLAVKQIELLSKEFRFITAVAGEKVISIDEELKMCKVHLDIFNARQHSDFKLESKGIIPNSLIPPMIFHTLIENGLTHSNNQKGIFIIKQEETQNAIEFIITSEPLIKQTFNGEGLGISYIKSRLEQAFPGRWEFTSEANGNVWKTKIKITK